LEIGGVPLICAVVEYVSNFEHDGEEVFQILIISHTFHGDFDSSQVLVEGHELGVELQFELETLESLDQVWNLG